MKTRAVRIFQQRVQAIAKWHLVSSTLFYLVQVSTNKTSQANCDFTDDSQVHQENPIMLNYCLWCSSASHHQLCTGFMDTAKQEIFLIPLVEMFLLALRRLLSEGFSKFSKLTKL